MVKAKLGPAKRFGPRYGMKPKRIFDEIERIQRAWHVCPRCKSRRVKRIAAGIWQCRKCGYKFAAGAFKPIMG